MLDIGFPEMLLVALVMLLVFGPERLPEVLRTVGRWIGGARRSFSSFRAELEREIGADEIRRDLHNSQILEEARKVREELNRAGSEMRVSEAEMDRMVRERMQGIDRQIEAAEQEQEQEQGSHTDASGTEGSSSPAASDAAADSGQDTRKP